MSAKKGFYTIAILGLAVLFINAIRTTSEYNGRKDAKKLDHFETLTFQQCVERYEVVRGELKREVRTGAEYFQILKHAYGLQGSGRKAMFDPPATWTDTEKHPNLRTYDIVHSMVIEIQPLIDDFARINQEFMLRASDTIAERNKFNESGFDPTREPEVSVTGIEKVLLAWGWIQFGMMPFVVIHFFVQLYLMKRRNPRISILQEVFWNEKFSFWFWLLLWEVGLFRYPREINPMEQLRRARRLAALVLTTAISCFAGTGKVCESKREHAPQFQKYDGPLPPFIRGIAFSTATLSRYLGDDGKIFFPAPVQQSSFTLGLPCGWYLNVFNSEPLGDRGFNPNFGREFDYKVGNTFTASKLWNLSFDSSVAYVNASPQWRIPRGDIVQLQEVIRKSFALSDKTTVSPYLMIRTAVPLRDGNPVGGTFEFLGSRFTRTVGAASLSVDVALDHDPGAFGAKEDGNVRVLTDVAWKTRGGLLLHFPTVNFYDPISHAGDGRGPRWVFGAGLSFASSR